MGGRKLGDPTDYLPPGCRSLGIPEDLEAFAQKVAALAKQFRVLKLKLGSCDLGLDLAHRLRGPPRPPLRRN